LTEAETSVSLVLTRALESYSTRFMQSAPTEASQTATSVDPSSDSSTSNQYGLSDSHQQASGTVLLEHASVPSIERSDDVEAASVTSRGSSRGRQPKSGRLGNRQDTSQDSSPGSRIDEYERAHTVTRIPSDGMIFQVISNSGTSRVSIQDFPNGILPRCLPINF
jgi:hypothetical protein